MNNINNKIILPLYLHKEIIKYLSIIINNLKYKCFYEPYNIDIHEELYFNKNEIFNYLMVSHYWFNSFKSFINYSINFKYKNNINNDNKFKLISIKDNIKTIYITKYNDNILNNKNSNNYLENRYGDNENSLKLKFISLENIILFKNFFLNNNNNQSNEFNSYIWNYLNDILSGLNVEIHISINPENPKLPFNKCKFKSVDYLDIDSNSIHSRDTLTYIRYFKPKKLKLYERNFDDLEIDQHFYYYKELFDTSNINSKLFSQNIESIELIDIINIEELYYIISKTLNNLKYLKVSLCFETLVFNLSNSSNQQQNITIMGEVDNFHYYWNQVYNLIISHLNLNYLIVESKCKEFHCNHYVQQLNNNNEINNISYNFNNSLFYYYQQYHQKPFNDVFLDQFGSMITNNTSLKQFKFIEENNWKLQLYNNIKTNNKNKDLILI